MRCDRCIEEAIVDRPYAGDHLCAVHLSVTVGDRVRREMHRQAPKFVRGTVAVALSGGKDSAVTLAMTQRYFARRPTVRILAITVDEGIAGYRSKTVERAKELSERLGLEHRIVCARDEIGTTTDATAARLPGVAPCSFCGVWRRRLLNSAARAAGADLLVLGFNLDDLAQTVLMNLARAEVDRLLRMSPHRSRQAGLIPRIAPLATIPEREVYLYAQSQGIPFDHGECPHASSAERNVFREVVWRLEEARPGTRHALLRTREAVADLLIAHGRDGSPGTCTVCGEPSARPTCRSCVYRRDAGLAVMGLDASGAA